jgi:UDP-glucose 4-epimerase
MIVVVSGAAGFIGSHCVDAFVREGFEVIGVDNFVSGRRDNLKHLSRGFRLVEGDVYDPKLWSQIPSAHAFVHLAGQASVSTSVLNAVRDFELNAAGWPTLLEVLAHKSVRACVLGSTTGALYGKALTYPTDERAPLRPQSPYGASKAAAELVLQAGTAAKKAAGGWSSVVSDSRYFSYAVLRLANVLGDRQRPQGTSFVVPQFIEALSAGRSPNIFGDGKNTRDYVGVLEVAQAFLLATKKLFETPLDETFNVGSGQELSDLEVFELVLKSMHEIGSDAHSLEAYKKSLTVVKPQFDLQKPGEVTRSFVDVRKIEAYLNWKAKTPVQQIIQSTVAAYF